MLPDPVEVIHFRMDQYGMACKDLEPFIGQSGRVSEVLNYQRRLSITMLRKLSSGLNIPTESLIKENELRV